MGKLTKRDFNKMWINFYWIMFIGAICSFAQIDAVESVILDSRCYLEGGGSAESFLATEDLEIGSIIGKLRINGNPTIEDGDINLTLREKNSPVEIIPGTKNLILSTELDKEGLEGPSSIYVNIICMRRHSTDPSFVIPVNVRVIDVNDNAPKWVGTPYTLTLSEVTVPGTRILQSANAEDNDQPGPFSTVEYRILPGTFAEYVQFLNPLEGTLVLRKALDYETVENFTIEMRAQDQGTPPKYSDTTLQVIITDADDQNPKFLHESYRGEVPTDGRPGEIRIRPESIKALDQDEGICAPIQYSIVQSQDTKYFRIHPNTGAITLLTPIGYSDLINGATLVVKATQIDNPDRYALTTVLLTRSGSTHSDIATLNFVQKKFFMRIREDAAIGNRLLALPTNKPGKHLKYTIADPVNAEIFNIGSLGEVILHKPLDYEKMTKHDFQVMASDGLTNTTAEIVFEVIDVNDWEPRFRETHYEFFVPKSQSLRSRSEALDGIMIGKVEAADGDRNDKLELSLRGQYASYFEIDTNGNIYMHPDKKLNESTIHLVAIATDSGDPPRSTSAPVTIKMEGIALAHTSWSNNLLGAFSLLLAIFIAIILALTCYIFRSKKKKRKNSKSRNRVHSQPPPHATTTVSAGKLVAQERKKPSNGGGSANTSAAAAAAAAAANESIIRAHPKFVGNVAMTSPINHGSSGGGGGGGVVGYHHGGSGSSLSVGASTILAASLEREAQRDRELERQRVSYAATVRSIVSRASANGQLYNDSDTIDRDSLSIHEDNNPNSNNLQQQQQQHLHRHPDNNNRKTAWETIPKPGLLLPTENARSSENNLTVYF